MTHGLVFAAKETAAQERQEQGGDSGRNAALSGVRLDPAGTHLSEFDCSLTYLDPAATSFI